MKKIFFVIFAIFILVNLYGQPRGKPYYTEKFKADKDTRSWERIQQVFDTTIAKYIAVLDLKKEGVIVVKIISLNEKSCSFVISIIMNRLSIFDIDSVTNYFDHNGRLVIVQGGKFNKLLNDSLKYKYFSQNIYFSKKHKKLTSPVGRFILMEGHTQFIVDFNRKKIKIDYFYGHYLELKYSIWK